MLGAEGDLIVCCRQLVPSGTEMTNVIGNKSGHGEHLGGRVHTHNLLGIGKGVGQGAGGKSDTTAEIKDPGLFLAELGGQFFGNFSTNIDSFVSNFVDHLGGNGGESGVKLWWRRLTRVNNQKKCQHIKLH